jgi:hypothetical protein
MCECDTSSQKHPKNDKGKFSKIMGATYLYIPVFFFCSVTDNSHRRQHIIFVRSCDGLTVFWSPSSNRLFIYVSSFSERIFLIGTMTWYQRTD